MNSIDEDKLNNNKNVNNRSTKFFFRVLFN